MLQLEYSLLCHEESALIRKAMFIEANRARYEAHSERMQGNQHAAGSHDYPSDRQSQGPGHNHYSFECGHRHGLVHEDSAIRADFVELKCAESSWWTKWSGANDGDIVMMQKSRTLVKSSRNEMKAMRFNVGSCRSNAKKIAITAAKKAAKEAAAVKQWSSFGFKK